MAPDATAPYSTGKACFRWLVPIDRLREIDSTKDLVSNSGVFIEWAAEDRRLVAYPCTNDTIFNLCAFLPSAEAGVQADGGWLLYFSFIFSFFFCLYYENLTNQGC